MSSSSYSSVNTLVTTSAGSGVLRPAALGTSAGWAVQCPGHGILVSEGLVSVLQSHWNRYHVSLCLWRLNDSFINVDRSTSDNTPSQSKDYSVSNGRDASVGALPGEVACSPLMCDSSCNCLGLELNWEHVPPAGLGPPLYTALTWTGLSVRRLIRPHSAERRED